MRADDFVLLRFNHRWVEFRQFGDLPADNLFRRDASQVVKALLTLLDLDADGLAGIVDQFSDRSLVAKGRPVLLLGLIDGLIALLIARRWLGRVPGISRRLLEPLDLRLQLPILFFQALDSCNQSFDQRHQIGVRNLIELVTAWQYHFRPEDIRFHETRE